MKKFISMVMAAAMVVSLVPATAFAANVATIKVVNDQEYTEDEAKAHDGDKGDTFITGPEVQMKIKDVDTKAGESDEFEITLDFENAEMGTLSDTDKSRGGVSGKDATVTLKEAVEAEDTSVTLLVTEGNDDLADDDVILIDLATLNLYLTKTSKNTEATVEVSGDFGDSDALTFVAVLDFGIDVTLKKVAEVAEEESTKLEKDLKIEATVGTFATNQEIELKLNSGFEWDGVKVNDILGGALKVTDIDENVLTTVVVKAGQDEITISKDSLKIEAVDAKVGDVAKITVKAKEDADVPGSFKATAEAVEAAKVVGDTVTMSVDEDEDVPVIYSGVNVDNDGINDDSDHKSLEVTLEESVKEALDVKKSFTLTLPEGVYATDVDVTGQDNVNIVSGTVKEAFEKAYEKGEYDCFEFARKTFDDSTEAFELTFELTLVAEPGFEGDVTLTLGGDAFEDEQEVVIAKFVAPYTVEAQQNDLIIDYRNTEVPTDIVVKEAEAGLWDTGLEFTFDIERFNDNAFEDDATYTVNEDDSDMEIKEAKSGLGFTVDEESDDEAAVVTISDISLYMGRNIAAGAYDLELMTNAAKAMYLEELVTKETTDLVGYNVALYTVADAADFVKSHDLDIDPVVAKEGFINVITAGRDQDDASFTKKVVVPVGESYLIAGEETVTLDVPAYVSANGYTMLPVRAVATALGINNNSVLWDQATKTVTILYGQRIITMVAGQKVVYVNGSAIPASASVEIVNGRTFLPMRDLATALGVTDITWDAATKTATLNGNK